MKTYTASDFIDADITITRIRSVEHTVTKSWSRPVQRPRECEGLLYFVSGAIEYHFETYTFRAYPGQVLKLPAGIPYNGTKLDDGPLEFYLIDFEVLPGDFARFPLPEAFTPSDGEAAVREFTQLMQLWRQHTICSYMECKNAASAFLCSLAKDFAVNACHYDDRSRILQICEYNKQCMTEPGLHIAQIAAHFHLSEAHLRRIFSAELHVSPTEYIANLRLERAKSMLISRTDHDISKIAYECGYSSVYYFSSVFRNKVGFSPTRYRMLCSDQSES